MDGGGGAQQLPGLAQVVEPVDGDALAGAENEEHDREAEADLRGGEGDDEQRHRLPAVQRVAQPHVEGDEVEVGRVEHDLDRHEDEDRVAPGQDAVDARGEQQRRHDGRVDEVHQPAPPNRAGGRSRRVDAARDSTTAPTNAASSSTDRTSNGSTQVRNSAPPVALADPPPAAACRSTYAVRSASTTSVTSAAAVAT